MQHRFAYARGYYASTLCEKLVKIGPVTSEFKRAKIKNCAATRLQFDDRPSFGTRAFARGQHYDAERAIRQALPRISSYYYFY